MSMEPSTQSIKKIPLSLVDDPPEAVRTYMNKEALDDLVESIRANGLIQPIVVKPKNGRFEVVVGHRRLQAHRILEAAEIEAIVKNYDDEQTESTKLHENIFREEVNPVDEALFLARYIKKTNTGLSDLAKMLHRSIEWVAARLDILEYPDYMIEEVHHGRLTLGAARWLSQIQDDKIRREYTRFAVLQGVNIQTARRWAELAKDKKLPETPAHMTEEEAANDDDGYLVVAKCAICGENDEMARMESDLLHPACRREMALQLEAARMRTAGG